MKAWQVPVSLQGSGVLARAHFFPAVGQRHQLVHAACGRRFNPGFAVLAKRGTHRCCDCRESIRQGRTIGHRRNGR